MRLLYVDERKTWHTLMEKVLVPRGYEVEHAFSVEEAVEKIKEGKADIVIIDFSIKAENILELLKAIKEFQIPFLVFGYESMGFGAERLKDFGVDSVLTKPFTVEDLLGVLNELKERVREKEVKPEEKELQQVEEVSEEETKEEEKPSVRVSQETVERIIREVAWEVIPELAEKILREEIQKLIKSRLADV
jgi:DNA-binding response OmpR family regulator